MLINFFFQTKTHERRGRFLATTSSRKCRCCSGNISTSRRNRPKNRNPLQNRSHSPDRGRFRPDRRKVPDLWRITPKIYRRNRKIRDSLWPPLRRNRKLWRSPPPGRRASSPSSQRSRMCLTNVSRHFEFNYHFIYLESS